MLFGQTEVSASIAVNAGCTSIVPSKLANDAHSCGACELCLLCGTAAAIALCGRNPEDPPLNKAFTI